MKRQLLCLLAIGMACCLGHAQRGTVSLVRPLLLQALDSAPSSVRLNGGLEARLTRVGRMKFENLLTFTIELTNDSPNVAYLALATFPVATDNIGGTMHGLQSISGIGKCRDLSLQPIACIQPDGGLTLSLQSFTRVDPGRTITINMVLHGVRIEGPQVSLSMDLLCRFVSDPAADSSKTEAERYRQFELISVGFPSKNVTQAN